MFLLNYFNISISQNKILFQSALNSHAIPTYYYITYEFLVGFGAV